VAFWLDEEVADSPASSVAFSGDNGTETSLFDDFRDLNKEPVDPFLMEDRWPRVVLFDEFSELSDEDDELFDRFEDAFGELLDVIEESLDESFIADEPFRELADREESLSCKELFDMALEDVALMDRSDVPCEGVP
jgi:hypothetical protein